MKSIKTVSLIILTTVVVNLTECNGDVSILINKKYDAKCPKAVLGIPISNSGLPITEFTFCGKYYFRHLKGSVDLLPHFTKVKCDSWT